MIEHDMACTVCAYSLNAIHHDGQISYEHPIVPDKDDHDPEPVPAHHVDNVYRRCHVCSTDEPVWAYRTAPIEAMSVGGTRPVVQTYSTLWKVCCRCAQLIEHDDKRAVLHLMQPFDSVSMSAFGFSEIVAGAGSGWIRLGWRNCLNDVALGATWLR